MKKIVLVDGNSLMFRAYYATAYSGVMMQNSKGIYTNAIYGFVNMISSLVEQEHDNMFIAFDKGSKTLRHQSFQDYKATRKKLPEELAMQIPLIKEYLDILKITQYEADDYEADDLIATLAKKAYDSFDVIQVITGDKDLLQLVNDKTTVCLTRKGINELEDFTVDNFFEKMGIYPNQIPDYKGLVGDSSDNLPGIKGIGDKTAVKLLTQYPTLEKIIENLDTIGGRTQTLIEENKEMGLQCKALATLEFDAPVNFVLNDTRKEEFDTIKLRNFFMEMDFNTFLKRLDKKTQDTKTAKKIEYTLIEDVTFDFKDILLPDGFIVLESFGKNYYNGEVLGLAVINEKGNYFIKKEVLFENESLKSYLANAKITKKTFDAKKMYVMLKNNNIDVRGIDYDLMLASYIINPTFGADDIKKATQNIFESSIPFEENIYGANTKAAIPEVDIYAKYAVEKAMLIQDSYDTVLEQLKEMDGMQLLNDLELPLSFILGDMEIQGLKIDEVTLEQIGSELSEQLKEAEADIYELAGESFNINSVKQLGAILFEKLNLPHGKKNKTGYSTNVDVLENLASDFEIAGKVLEYRGINKLITTYVNGLRDVTTNSFIHPLYKQALTVTGRLSSNEPNIQNMPIRTELGQGIRKIFVSRFDQGVIVAADYSQIELRILAHLAKEEEMIAAFKRGVDFHAQTASTLYEVPLEDVTREMRRVAKAINFGIIYGMSAWGLSENLRISPLEANIFISKYFDRYRKVKEFLDFVVEDAKEKGFTKTIFNRRRYIPELSNKNNNIREFGKRTAMNAPIQGSAADIIKKAMIDVKQAMEENKMKSILIAQVHDELIFDTVLEEKEQLLAIVKDKMEKAVELSVPLNVEGGFGKSWYESK